MSYAPAGPEVSVGGRCGGGRESPRPPVGASGRRVIEVAHLRKLYGSTVAVDDVSFEVFEGEIFGLIGPNGAGKTTAMECVEGVRKADAGRATVLGLDPARDARALQQRIGVQLQQAQLQKRIRVREAVELWASLYPRAVDGRAMAADHHRQLARFHH